MVTMIIHYHLAYSGAAALGIKCEICSDSVSTLSIQHIGSLLAVGRATGLMILYGRHRDLFPGIDS